MSFILVKRSSLKTDTVMPSITTVDASMTEMIVANQTTWLAVAAMEIGALAKRLARDYVVLLVNIRNSLSIRSCFCTYFCPLELCSNNENFNVANLDDGICDDDLNVRECNFDVGDCCLVETVTDFCNVCECIV